MLSIDEYLTTHAPTLLRLELFFAGMVLATGCGIALHGAHRLRSPPHPLPYPSDARTLTFTRTGEGEKLPLPPLVKHAQAVPTVGDIEEAYVGLGRTPASALVESTSARLESAVAAVGVGGGAGKGAGAGAGTSGGGWSPVAELGTRCGQLCHLRVFTKLRETVCSGW